LNFWFEAIYKNLRIVRKIELHMKLLAAYGLGQMQTIPSVVFSQASSKEKKNHLKRLANANNNFK